MDHQSDMKSMGSRLRKAREIQGISIPLLSIIVGVVSREILNWERGIKSIPNEKTQELCRCLNIKRSWLLKGTAYPFSENRALKIIPEKSLTLLSKIIRQADKVFAIFTEKNRQNGKYVLVFKMGNKINVLLALVSDRNQFDVFLKNMNVNIIRKIKSQLENEDDFYRDSIGIQNEIHQLKNEAGTLKAFMEGLLRNQNDPGKFLKKYKNSGITALDNIMKRLDKIFE